MELKITAEFLLVLILTLLYLQEDYVIFKGGDTLKESVWCCLGLLQLICKQKPK